MSSAPSVVPISSRQDFVQNSKVFSNSGASPQKLKQPQFEQNEDGSGAVALQPVSHTSSEDPIQKSPQRRQYVYYKSPDICCCDVQTGLTAMAILDIIIAFICCIYFINALAGPTRPSSHPRPVHYSHHRPYYYHRPHHIFKRAVNDTNLKSTTLNTTTEGNENTDKTYESVGAIVSALVTVASIMLLISAVSRKRTLCWISQLFGWIVFLGATVFFCLVIFGSNSAGDSGGSLAAIAIAILYRIYETVVVYYFIKEPDPPPPPPVRYVTADDGVIYAGSPQVIYAPSGVYGYGQPYYGGYGYGYGPGVGMTAGLGLGLALGGGYGHYDHCDGGYGYDCY